MRWRPILLELGYVSPAILSLPKSCQEHLQHVVVLFSDNSDCPFSAILEPKGHDYALTADTTPGCAALSVTNPLVDDIWP